MACTLIGAVPRRPICSLTAISRVRIRRQKAHFTIDRTNGRSSRRPMTSVMKPGTSRIAAAMRTSAPSKTSPEGISPAARVARKRRQTSMPTRLASAAPKMLTMKSSTSMGRTPMRWATQTSALNSATGTTTSSRTRRAITTASVPLMSAVSLPPPRSASALRSLTAARARELLAGDALAIDLRPVGEYLAGHIHGSIPLLFEPGPGLGGRARDLLPLDARLVLLDDGTSPLERAADSFRGKGFDVVGTLAGGVKASADPLVTTPVMQPAGARHVLALVHSR